MRPLFFLLIGSVSLSIVGCSLLELEQALKWPKDTANVSQSIVLITYGDEPGYSTGFLIDGGRNFCAVLTVAQALPEEQEMKITTFDNQLFDVVEINHIPDVDLAVAAFDPGDMQRCPFPSLTIGDSNRVNLRDVVSMAGYPEQPVDKYLVAQVYPGEITSVSSSPLPNSYSFSYDITPPAPGMRGAPILNAAGKVIAVHGLTDIELMNLAQDQQITLSDDQRNVLNQAEGQTENLTQINHSGWGVPIRAFRTRRRVLMSNIKTLFARIERLLKKADRLKGNERYAASLPIYEEVLQLNAFQEEAWFGRGDSLNGLGRYEEAIESYNRAIEIRPNYSAAWHNRGNALASLGLHERSLESYAKALDVDASEIEVQHAQTWHNRGASLAALGRYEEAIESYDRALAIDLALEKVWYNRGYWLSEMARHEEAIESYDMALEISPNYVAALVNRGSSLKSLDRHEEAIESYDQALALVPELDIAWFNRGNSLHQLERYEEAIESYDRVLEIVPNHSSSWNNRGSSLENLVRYEEALESYRKAIESDPSNTRAINNQRSLLEKLN